MPFSEKDLNLLRAHANATDGDLELLRAMAEEVMNRRNSAPIDDFAGLSPNEMTAFLYLAFDSPELIELPEILSSEPSAPILDLLLPLFEQLTQKPAKLTAKGNLPTAFVNEMVANYAPSHDEDLDLTKEYAHNEDTFMDLHVARTVADLAGLVYKRQGKLHLTKKAAKLRSEHGAAGLYPAVLRTYVGKFNWAYGDGYGPLPLIQQSWAFTCFLLQRFLGFLGLVTYTWEKKPRSKAVSTLTRTPLLMDAVRLHVG